MIDFGPPKSPQLQPLSTGNASAAPSSRDKSVLSVLPGALLLLGVAATVAWVGFLGWCAVSLVL